jgi:aspartate aminotransferase
MISQSIKESLKNSSAIRKMFEEGMRLSKIYGEENVFDYSLGNPDMPPPKEITEGIKKYADMPGVHKYMPNAGYPDVREAIAKKISGRGKEVTAQNIIMTVGAAGALNAALKALLDPDDEVIIVAPYFVEYLFYIKNHGGVPVIVESEKDFSLDIEKIYGAVTEKTKAILLNSPNNPTGVIYSEESLRELADSLYERQNALQTDICILSDEPYVEIVYDAEVPNLLDIYENTVIASSFSKSLSLPGGRIGYAVVGPDMTDVAEVINAITFTNRTLGFVNAPAIYQKALLEAMDSSVDVAEYKARRDELYDILTEAGFDAYKPEGTFYFFVKSPVKDDAEFVAAATGHNLLFAPGKGFGKPGYFRICYCMPLEKIKRSKKAFMELGREFGLI